MNAWLQTTTADLIRDGVLEIGDGYRAKNAEFAPGGGLPFVRVGDVGASTLRVEGTDELPREDQAKYEPKVSRPGDSLITMKGTVGRVAFVAHDLRPFVYSPQLSYWRSRNNEVVHPRWLRYWLESPEFSWQASATKGATDMADYVNLRDQRRMQISLPPLRVQKRIAEVLGSIDDVIESNRRRVEVLAEMARAIYREWFVHFRYPGYHDDSLVDSALGPVPEGWSVRALGESAKALVDGDWVETKDQGGTSYRLLQVSNIGLGSFRETGKYRYITEETFQRLNCTEVVIGDILISRMPEPVGRAWLVDHLDERAVTVVDVALLTPISEPMGVYLNQVLNSPEQLNHAATVATGTTRKRITRSVLAQNRVLVPDDALLARFREQCAPALRMAVSLRLACRALASTRDLLLPMLVTGQIDVSRLDLDALTEASIT